MKKLLLALLIVPTITYAGWFNFLKAPAVGGGSGTINQLQQWSATTTPTDAITQTVFGKDVKLTGLTNGSNLCLDADGIITTTGCASGSGGGGVGTSTNPSMATYFVATSTTATSSLPIASTTQLMLNGDIVRDFTGSGLRVVNGALTSSTTVSDFIINVKDYGALGDGVTDDTTAINRALSVQQNASTTACMYFPAGVYPYNGTITLNNRPCIIGNSGGENFLETGFNDDTFVSRLEFTHNNAPGFILGSSGRMDNGRFEDMDFSYRYYQPYTNTESKMFDMRDGSKSHRFHNLTIRNAYRAFYSNDGESWQHDLNNITIPSFSGSCIRSYGSATSVTVNQFYCRNAWEESGSSTPVVNITNMTQSGSIITLTVDSVLDTMIPGRQGYIGLTSLGSYPSRFIIGTSTNTIVIQGNSTDTIGADVTGTFHIAGREIEGPAIDVSGVWNFTGLDIEHILPNSTSAFFSPYGNTNVTDVHFEQVYPNNTTFRFFSASDAVINVGAANLINLGCSTGQSCTLGYSNNIRSDVRVDSWNIRDVSTGSSTAFTVGQRGSTARNPWVGSVTFQTATKGTAAQPTITRGSADTSPRMAWASTTEAFQNGYTYITSRLGIGSTTPMAPLVVVGQGIGEYFTATSTTATSTLPQISSSVISSLWGSFTRLFVSGLSSDVGKYVVVGTNGELQATTTPQMTTIVPVSGTRNDTNTTFTTASEPLLLVINGQAWASTGGAITWSYSGGTITTSQPIGTGGDIYGLSLGVGLVTMVADPYTFYVPVISGDPTAVLQTYINTAAALATSTGQVSTLKFPATTYTTDQLTVQENTVWECTNTEFLKRSNASGLTNASVIATARYTVGGSYYGHGDSITIKGCSFSSNDKTLTQAIVKLWDVYDLKTDNITIYHTPTGQQHAINICGRNVTMTNTFIYGGTQTIQDGLHLNCGDNINISGGIIESGDDAIALGRDVAGSSNLGEDEGLTNVSISNLTVKSFRARCVNAYSGHDYIDSGFSNIRKVENFSITNITGYCAQTHGSGVAVLDEHDIDQIFEYNIISGGTGYTSGTYANQPTTGGGCSDQPAADVIITGGVITSVKPYSVGSGVFDVGSGCTSEPTLSLTGLGAGTGASVVGVRPVRNTALINNGTIQGTFYIGSTTASHDGTEPYGLYTNNGKNISLDLKMNFSSSTQNFRPWYIKCGDNYDIKWIQTGSTTQGGWIYPSEDSCELKNWRWHDGYFVGHDATTNPSDGVHYFRGGGARNWSFINNTYDEIQSAGTAVAWTSAVTATTTDIKFIGNTFIEKAGAAVSRAFNMQSCINCVTGMVVTGNNFSRVDNPINSATGFQNSVVSYTYNDNVGSDSVKCQTGTITAGATSTTMTVQTPMGLTTSNTLGMGHIKPTFTGTLYATTSLTSIAVSTTTYILGVQSPVSSNQAIMSCEDTSKKPLN